MRLAWGQRVSADFRRRVCEICERLGIDDPSWLMACMAFETGRTFSPSVRNSVSGATGLIQFMPTTARGMGTTTEQLALMSAEEQLDWVEAYFKPCADRIHSLSDCYMVILWPKAVGQPENAVLFAGGSAAYLQNKGLDVDHDATVTKAECAAKVAALLAEGLRPDNVYEQGGEQEAARAVELAPEIVFNPDGNTATAQDAEAEVAASTTEHSMASILGTISAVSGAAAPFFPPAAIVSAGAGLLGKLLEALAPTVQEKASKELQRHGVSAETSNIVTGALLDVAKSITGKADELDAVAAVRADPAVAARVSQAVDVKLDELAPLLDKLHGYDKDAWSAEEDSRDRAAARATERDPIGNWLLGSAIAFGALILLGLMTGIGYQIVTTTDHKAAGELMSLFGNIVMLLIGVYVAISNFRFGSSRSSSAKDVLIGEMAKKRGA